VTYCVYTIVQIVARQRVIVACHRIAQAPLTSICSGFVVHQAVQQAVQHIHNMSYNRSTKIESQQQIHILRLFQLVARLVVQQVYNKSK